MSGRHRKTFSSFHSCLTDSSTIHLIQLIKLIQHKVRKIRVLVFPWRHNRLDSLEYHRILSDNLLIIGQQTCAS